MWPVVIKKKEKKTLNYDSNFPDKCILSPGKMICMTFLLGPVHLTWKNDKLTAYHAAEVELNEVFHLFLRI